MTQNCVTDTGGHGHWSRASRHYTALQKEYTHGTQTTHFRFRARTSLSNARAARCPVYTVHTSESPRRRLTTTHSAAGDSALQVASTTHSWHILRARTCPAPPTTQLPTLTTTAPRRWRGSQTPRQPPCMACCRAARSGPREWQLAAPRCAHTRDKSRAIY